MYTYRKEYLLNYFSQILLRTISEDASNWMAEKTFQVIDNNIPVFYMAFTAAPRHTGKAVIKLLKGEQELIAGIIPGFNLTGYTADRLARIILLLNLPDKNKENYTGSISRLYKAAEMNEQVALYGALPLLAYPEEWIEQCREGIRSNIGSVLEAIICDNPYPSQYLPEPAWNQLVLKAFFTEKPVDRITGLDRRANKDLAYTLSDYAHERWAAGRIVDLLLWRVVSGFIDKRIYPDIQKVFEEGNEYDKAAAALACAKSNYPPAKALLDGSPLLKEAIKSNKLNWEILMRTLRVSSDAMN